MKFEELLKKYKDGTATPEECAAVEEELEKARLIEEFLAQEAAPLPLPEVVATGEVKAVRHTIKHRTRNTALAVAAGVLALLLLLQFVLLPLLNRQVFDDSDYNPDPKYLSEYEMSLDILTQLYLPFYCYYGSEKTTTGFGQWTISNAFWGPNGTYVSPDFTVTAGVLDTTSNEAFWMFPPVNTVEITDRYQQEGMGKMDQALARMNDSIEVTAAVSFNRELTLEEVLALRKAYKETIDVDAATLAWPGSRPVQLSFWGSGIGWGDPVNEGYPLLWSFSLKDFTAEDWHQHFESQLRYLVDHAGQLGKKFDVISPEGLLDRYEEFGLVFSGMWVTGSAEDLLSLYESGVVGNIIAQDAYIDLYG